MALEQNLSCVGQKEPFKEKAPQTTDDESDSDDSLPSAYDDASFMVTKDFKEDVIRGYTNHGSAKANNESNNNGNTNRKNFYGKVEQPSTKFEKPGSFSSQGPKKTRASGEEWTPSRPQMFRHRSQLNRWPDLWRRDETGPTELSSTLDRIRDSIDYLASECSTAKPNVLVTHSGPNQAASRTSLKPLFGEQQSKNNAPVSILPNELNPRVPEWRRRERGFVPSLTDQSGQNRFRAGQPTLAAGASAEMASDYTFNARHRAIQSGKMTTIGSTQRPFNRQADSSFLSRVSKAHSPRQTHPFIRTPSTAAKSDHTNPRTPQSASNPPATASNPTGNGLTPFPLAPPLALNWSVTQAPSSTSLNSHPIRPPQGRFVPFPNYPQENIAEAPFSTPSKPPPQPLPMRASTPLPLTPIHRPLSPRTEYRITGYTRTDSTVLWADSMAPAIVPPCARHSATSLPEPGFLPASQAVCSPSTSSTTTPTSPTATAISIVTPHTPPTLPDSLRLYLEAKNERLRKHREGDAWRARHAAEVVRRHEQTVFAPRAGDGDRALMGWHMSAEYHGVGVGRGASKEGREERDGNGNGNGNYKEGCNGSGYGSGSRSGSGEFRGRGSGRGRGRWTDF